MSEDECHRVKDMIREEMEQAMKLDVPLVVNMETGTSLAK
jgi:DNA polymerase I-like protein with 3'-5' exonuclease and polymerase domains